MKTPLIGLISMNTKSIKPLQEKLGTAGAGYTMQRNTYINAIEEAGGVVLIMHVPSSKELLNRQLELIDGLLLPGGLDINPKNYGEEPDYEVLDKNLDEERDLTESYIIKKVIELKKPIIGICRGMQAINVAEGGTLYQDIRKYAGITQGHVSITGLYPSTLSDCYQTTINFEKDSKVSQILGTQSCACSCAHHQAIKDLAKGYKAVGKSDDGVIEVIEKEEAGSWVVGVQGHPEAFLDNNPLYKNLFKEFIRQASLIK